MATTRTPQKRRETSVAGVVKKKSGIVLDVGCGASKQPGAVGMDRQALPGVDVVHDWDVFPWPFEDESVLLIIASHVVEHVSPINGHFLNWLGECWRVLKPGRQIAIACPYGVNDLFVQDPTHSNPCNQTTWIYMDPLHDSGFYRFYEPAPFEIVQNLYQSNGMMEVVLRKRADQPEYHQDGKIHWGAGASK